MASFEHDADMTAASVDQDEKKQKKEHGHGHTHSHDHNEAAAKIVAIGTVTLGGATFTSASAAILCVQPCVAFARIAHPRLRDRLSHRSRS